MGLFIGCLFFLMAVGAQWANAKNVPLLQKEQTRHPGVVLQQMYWPDKLQPQMGVYGHTSHWPKYPTTSRRLPPPTSAQPMQPGLVVKPHRPPVHPPGHPPTYKPRMVPMNTQTQTGYAPKLPQQQVPPRPHGQFPYYVQVPSYRLNLWQQNPPGPTASPVIKMPQYVTSYPKQAQPTAQLPRYAPYNSLQVKPEVSRHLHHRPRPNQQRVLLPPPPKKTDVPGYTSNMQPKVPNVPGYPVQMPQNFQYQDRKGPDRLYQQMLDYPTFENYDHYKCNVHTLVPHVPKYPVDQPKRPPSWGRHLVTGSPVKQLQQPQMPGYKWSPVYGRRFPTHAMRV